MNNLNHKMRIWHRYLGFYLVGIMAVYAVSGMILIFRKTDTFKKEIQVQKSISKGLSETQLVEELSIGKLNNISFQENFILFDKGQYNIITGEVQYTKMVYPLILDKLIKLHKATTYSPVYWLNLFFGASLLFFVISSFWMFLPDTSAFRKGLYFSIAGIVMTVIILFL